MSTSSNPDDYDGNKDLQPDGTGMPYLDIFSLPSDGESGGLASGTEQYYSVDYGNVHVVSLDSQLSARDPAQREAMKEWLVADLAANDRDWTIVIFHHPPYTKGANHDSDDADGGLRHRPAGMGYAQRVHAGLRGLWRGCRLQRALALLRAFLLPARTYRHLGYLLAR